MPKKKMRVLFLAKQTFSSVEAVKYMLENHRNIDVVFAVLRDCDNELITKCRGAGVRIGPEDELQELYDRGEIEADYLFSFYWKLVKEPTLAIARLGNINFHPGPLPEARGSGYHAAILENWGYWGVTAHYMDKNFDTGDIIECRRFAVPENIVNRDLVNLTHEQLFLLFRNVVSALLKGDRLNAVRQKEGKYYSLPDLENAKFISGVESFEEIDRKIRAFWNPPHRGAQIMVNGRNYTIINDQILHWVSEQISGNKRGECDGKPI